INTLMERVLLRGSDVPNTNAISPTKIGDATLPKGLLIAIDDAHHMNPLSWQLLYQVLKNCPRLLVTLTVRNIHQIFDDVEKPTTTTNKLSASQDIPISPALSKHEKEKTTTDNQYF